MLTVLTSGICRSAILVCETTLQYALLMANVVPILFMSIHVHVNINLFSLCH